MTIRTPSRQCVVALAGLLAITGSCSDDDDETDTSSPAAGTATSVAETAVSSEPFTVPELTEPVGVVNDVVIDECTMKKGAVRANGTAVNSADADGDIAITILWMLNNSDDPISLASTTLEDVPAGDEVEWSVETDIERAAERCVINARRGTS